MEKKYMNNNGFNGNGFGTIEEGILAMFKAPHLLLHMEAAYRAMEKGKGIYPVSEPIREQLAKLNKKKY